jgi:mannan endo-1,4-beta-mannosidase
MLFVASSFASAPINPNASPEARALLDYLYRISGHQTLSGQHNQPGLKTGPSGMCDKVNELVGKYPAAWGYDFGFRTNGLDGINHRPAIIAEAIQQHQRGSIITLTWHAVCPLDDEPNEWKQSVWHKMTEAEWNELVTPGMPLNRHWQAQVDVIAGFLKQLQVARVPVLWRPYHEMNGDWFWWCGKKGERGFKLLWRLMYDRFVNHHHLDNLLWVWSPNAPGGIVGPYADYFPGRDAVDVLAVDVYIGFKQPFHDDLVALAAGKPVALGEGRQIARTGGAGGPAALGVVHGVEQHADRQEQARGDSGAVPDPANPDPRSGSVCRDQVGNQQPHRFGRALESRCPVHQPGHAPVPVCGRIPEAGQRLF